MGAGSGGGGPGFLPPPTPPPAPPPPPSQWAQAAEAGLPRGSILAFEIGNEPDIYSHADWMAITAGRPYLGRTVPYALTPRDYIRDFLTYARALRQVAPQAPAAPRRPG